MMGTQIPRVVRILLFPMKRVTWGYVFAYYEPSCDGFLYVRELMRLNHSQQAAGQLGRVGASQCSLSHCVSLDKDKLRGPPQVSQVVIFVLHLQMSTAKLRPSEHLLKEGSR